MQAKKKLILRLASWAGLVLLAAATTAIVGLLTEVASARGASPTCLAARR